MTKTTNSLLLAGVLSATLMTSVNVNAAETAAPAAEPASPHTLTTNVGLFTDYVFRGISYGKERGAIQGGVDYSHSSGVYLGVWASSVQADSFLAGNTTEIDLYGGYVHQFTPDLNVNVGLLQFYYPNHKTYAGYTSMNTTELNGAVTYKYFTLKHSYSLSDYFGLVGSDGTGYTEFNVAYSLPQVEGLNLAAHVGRLNVDGYSNLNCTDYLLGVNKDFSAFGTKGWNAGISYTYSDASTNDGTNGGTADYPKLADGFNWVGSHATFFLKRTF